MFITLMRSIAEAAPAVYKKASITKQSAMRKVKILSLATLFITFLLLILGGVVHNTESSLACPDWPLCYGQIFPKMEGSVLIEHSHRLLASLVGLMTIFLVVFARKQKEIVYKTSVLALVFVILQGILGGITVIYLLPTIVSTSHLALSMIFFSTLIFLHHHSSDVKADSFDKPDWNPRWKVMSFIGTALIYLQLVLGAFLRHSGAGASCGIGPKAALFCLETSTWQTTFWPMESPAQIHIVHRYFAVVIALFAIGFAVYSFKKIKKRSFKVMSLSILAAVLFQVFLGVLTVAKNISVVPTTAHLAGAALCLGLFWKMTLMIYSYEKELFGKSIPTFVQDIIELTKPKLAGLVLMTILVGMLVAPAEVSLFEGFRSFILMALVIMGATTLNCFIEKDVDKKMERTRDRSLPAGRLNPNVALALGVALLLVSIPGLVIFTNFETAFLALAAATLYLFAYTPMKQKSELAVYVGAIPGAIPPVMGWTAMSGSFDLISGVLFAILFIWQLPHFMAISMYHSRDYSAANIKVYPNLKGMVVTKHYILFFTLALLAAACSPALLGGAGPIYTRVAFGLSAAFLVLTGSGYLIGKSVAAHQKWARKYFLASVFYLPILLGALLFLR